MSIVLKLDAGALAALFPEGSEARTNLTHAVVVDFARKCIKKDFEGPAFRALQDVASAEAFRALQANKAEFGIETITKGGSWNTSVISITDAYREKIRQHVESTFRDILREEVRLQLQEFEQKLPELVAPIIERAKLPEEVAKVVRQKIVEQLNHALKAPL